MSLFPLMSALLDIVASYNSKIIFYLHVTVLALAASWLKRC